MCAGNLRTLPAATGRATSSDLHLSRQFLVKTTFLLRYIHERELRRRIQSQLNRGESRHLLARRLFFAHSGEFLRGDLREIMNKASCLSLLSNAVVAWNIVSMTKIVEGLRTRGEAIPDGALAHVWPLAHKHVIPWGQYCFSQAAPAREES